ncbi:PD-(D/E)XK nuclease family protein [Bacillus sp. ISL-45]|uniref:PD-(D/E)XK nuclease family protein n=1 Tax=Bacillus sp. ISL-45 TaxID=2819128 RepID=UPI001BE6CD95|nr:PD-(D/E)XK nuclease family protein [Bacillus sp. ISL-45]MBT2663055.1 PD-(D/E)XK nuclease family protein [Bacillus sp. ISL-45]
MPSFKLHGRDVNSIFQLMGYKENDISHSTAWVLSKCGSMLEIFIKDVCGVVGFNKENVEICVQEYDKGSGITDIEIRDDKDFFIIVEAKRGWVLPSKGQLLKYANRESFKKSYAKNKVIVTLSECSREYAYHNLEIKDANGIPIKHVSWKDVHDFTAAAYSSSSNSEKKLLKELQVYLRGLVTMQNQNSNEVYVVSLGSGKPDDCSLTWIGIVKKKNKYFHPMGGSGWPKEPPNYIAFRYVGKLQSIHHIEEYDVSTNPHNNIPEMPDREWEPHFIYSLGPAIKPSKEVKTGKIYPSGRVWCHLDTLLTCDTISDARDLTKKRME